MTRVASGRCDGRHIHSGGGGAHVICEEKDNIRPRYQFPVINSTSQSHPISTADLALRRSPPNLYDQNPTSAVLTSSTTRRYFLPVPPPPPPSTLRLDQSCYGVIWVLFWAGPASSQEHWILFEVVIRHGRLTCKINTPGSKLPASQRTHSY